MSPLFILSILVSVFFCGLTLDFGMMELHKTQLQSVADAAAGGAGLEVELGTSTFTAFGKQEAVMAGYTDGANNTAVSVFQTPTVGAYTGRYDAVQATITRSYPTIFMGALHGNSYSLTANTTALVPPCNVFLGGASSQYTYALALTNASLIATCPIYINNNFSADANSKLYGFGVNVTGGASASVANGHESQSTQGPASTPPQQLPTFGAAVVSDPLAIYSQPSASSCNYTSKSIISSTTLSPGTYCGTSSTPGLTINTDPSHPSTPVAVSMSAGLYVFTGGVKINNATLTGSGVSLFFTNGNGAGYGQILIGASGACTLNLTAPTNAQFGTQSILFWTDRNWVSTAANDFQFTGAGSFTGNGIWYLPNTGLAISQNTLSFAPSGSPAYGSFVARNASFSNTSVTTGQNVSTFNIGSLFRYQGGIAQ